MSARPVLCKSSDFSRFASLLPLLPLSQSRHWKPDSQSQLRRKSSGFAFEFYNRIRQCKNRPIQCTILRPSVTGARSSCGCLDTPKFGKWILDNFWRCTAAAANVKQSCRCSLLLLSALVMQFPSLSLQLTTFRRRYSFEIMGRDCIINAPRGTEL